MQLSFDLRRLDHPSIDYLFDFSARYRDVAPTFLLWLSEAVTAELAQRRATDRRQRTDIPVVKWSGKETAAALRVLLYWNQTITAAEAPAQARAFMANVTTVATVSAMNILERHEGCPHAVRPAETELAR